MFTGSATGLLVAPAGRLDRESHEGATDLVGGGAVTALAEQVKAITSSWRKAGAAPEDPHHI